MNRGNNRRIRLQESYLNLVTKKPITASIGRILSSLISREVACNFTMTGTDEKRAFNKMTICSVAHSMYFIVH